MDGPFTTLVFGGGGTRCFWHGGFMSVAEDRLPLDISRVSGVSGGALSAAAWITGRERQLLDSMTDAFDETKKGPGNIDLAALIGDDQPFPHQRLYTRIVHDLLDDYVASGLIADGPDFRIQLAKPGKLGAKGTIAAYAADIAVRSSPHPVLPKMTGAESVLVDAKEAARDGKLCDLIVAAASSPPLFDQHYWNGEPVIDGGVVDNAPPWAESDEPTLLLVTRPYSNLPEHANRLYAVPSEKPPTFKLDFTDAEGIRDVWRLGEDDGRAFLAEHFPD